MSEMSDLPTITKRLTFILIIALCVHAEITRDIPRDGIQPEVAPYVQTFNTYAETFIPGFKMPPMDIGLGTTTLLPHDDGRVVGFCDIWGPRLLVVLDRKYWEVSDDLEREELVFHELGHCVLNRGHTEDIMSMMYPSSLASNLYAPYRRRYIQELFAHHHYGKSKIYILLDNFIPTRYIPYDN